MEKCPQNSLRQREEFDKKVDEPILVFQSEREEECQVPNNNAKVFLMINCT